MGAAAVATQEAVSCCGGTSKSAAASGPNDGTDKRRPDTAGNAKTSAQYNMTNKDWEMRRVTTAYCDSQHKIN